MTNGVMKWKRKELCACEKKCYKKTRQDHMGTQHVIIFHEGNPKELLEKIVAEIRKEKVRPSNIKL